MNRHPKSDVKVQGLMVHSLEPIWETLGRKERPVPRVVGGDCLGEELTMDERLELGREGRNLEKWNKMIG